MSTTVRRLAALLTAVALGAGALGTVAAHAEPSQASTVAVDQKTPDALTPNKLDTTWG